MGKWIELKINMECSVSPPPSYGAATLQHAARIPGLNFVDFVPKCIEKKKYEPFSVLIQRGNKYLQDNPLLEVKTCEIVEFHLRNGELNLQKMSFTLGDFNREYRIRALRLWLVQRDLSSLPPQQIGYFDIIPKRLTEFAAQPEFESLDDMLQRINEKLKNKPLNGRILNVGMQTVNYIYFHNLEELDRTFRKDIEGLLVNILRVFYEVGRAEKELLGCIDFMPSIISYEAYSPFSSLVQRALHWCTQIQSGRFCNAQTLDCKIKSEGNNSKRMHFNMHPISGKPTKFVKFLRVYYVQPIIENTIISPSLVLSAKTFSPVRLSHKHRHQLHFENCDETNSKMQAWMNIVGCRVLSAETVCIWLDQGHLPEVVDSTSMVVEEYGKYLMVFRVYFDGAYEEPLETFIQSRLLPAPPEVNDDCCEIL